MNWLTERHGADKGFRREDGSAYVGKTFSGRYRPWVRDENGGMMQTADIFQDADEAKAMVA